ncbi:MAG: MFS transporter [Mycobacteriales bacterium]
MRLLPAAALARTADEAAGTAVLLACLARPGPHWLGPLLVGALTFPSIGTGPLLGALLDRARRPARAAALAQATVGTGLAVLAVTVRHAAPAPLVALAILTGLALPVVTGGWSAVLAASTPPERRARSRSYDAGSYALSGIAGPALAAGIGGLLGGSCALAVVAVLALVAAGIAATAPAATRRPARAAPPLASALRQGFAVVARRPPLRAVTVATTISQFGAGGWIVSTPLVAADLGYRPALGGTLVATFALGALAASAVQARYPLCRPDRAVGWSLAGMAAGFALVAVAPTAGVALAGAALAGAADSPLITATLAIRQRESPPALHGQVLTTAASLKVASFAVGAATAGLFGSPARMLALAAASQGVAIAATVRRGTLRSVEVLPQVEGGGDELSRPLPRQGVRR